MKASESGKDKVKKICEVLIKDTLDPAKEEAEKIVEKAQEEAKKIRDQAHLDAEQMLQEAKQKIKEERNVFQASLNLACKKSINYLKSEIENELLSKNIAEKVATLSKEPQTIALIIQAILASLEKEGLQDELEAYIPTSISPEAVNQHLLKETLEKLKDHTVKLGKLDGGAEIRLVGKNMTIEMTKESLKQVLGSFLREDFRKILFASM